MSEVAHQKLIQNEKIKLRATFFNNCSVAIFAALGIAPFAALAGWMMNNESSLFDNLFKGAVLVAFWFVAGVCAFRAHKEAQKELDRLEA